MKRRVTILGNGAMATVCSMLLVDNGHAVTMWGARAESIAALQANREQTRLLPGVRIPDEVVLTAEDAQALRNAELVMMAVPTQHQRAVCERLHPNWPDGLEIVSVAKGIEVSTLERPSQIVRELLPTRAVAVLSGPNIAAEMGRRMPATAVAACDDPQLAVRVQQAFSTPYFRVYTNDDPLGVELAGALKNVIAIAAGILDGLGAGDNAKAALVTRGLVEITRLGVLLGAKPETFSGLAGLGDLLTTCVSPQGRNRGVGERLGRGESLDAILASSASVAEGVPTTKAVTRLARERGVEMPITASLHSILFEGKCVREALVDLMTRQHKAE